VDDPEVRARFEAGWNVKLPSTKGLDNHEMIGRFTTASSRECICSARKSASWIQMANFVTDGLSKLEFFVAQDIFFRRHVPFCGLVLPASPSLEKEGTFTSSRAAPRRLYQVLEPWATAGPTGRSSRTSQPLGANGIMDTSEIYHEMVSLTPLFAGATYERLEG